MKSLILSFVAVAGLHASFAFAGTSPVDCLDSAGNKVLMLETVSGPMIISATHFPSGAALTDIRDVLPGLITAKAGSLAIVFLGYLKRATVLDEQGGITQELTCGHGDRKPPVPPSSKPMQCYEAETAGVCNSLPGCHWISRGFGIGCWPVF